MPHYKLLFPNDYVGAWDLDNGEKTVTIERIQVEELRNIKNDKADKKPVLFFKGAKKKMVLNKTNAGVIADLYGTNTDKWIGKAITLFATTCSAFGKQVECIRVRSEKPRNGKTAKAAPAHDPETGEIEPTQTDLLHEPPDDQPLPHD